MQDTDSTEANRSSTPRARLASSPRPAALQNARAVQVDPVERSAREEAVHLLAQALLAAGTGSAPWVGFMPGDAAVTVGVYEEGREALWRCLPEIRCVEGGDPAAATERVLRAHAIRADVTVVPLPAGLHILFETADDAVRCAALIRARLPWDLRVVDQLRTGLQRVGVVQAGVRVAGLVRVSALLPWEAAALHQALGGTLPKDFDEDDPDHLVPVVGLLVPLLRRTVGGDVRIDVIRDPDRPVVISPLTVDQAERLGTALG
ncbi:hypothetical protein [Streptomyces violascens]|uniref:hypothetical protein n=1 Tax=Streptomyces violascens TaxID=67381 RepID=UPI0016761099|nr:hypothetical protein [Streptomyces violascens]GGU38298.1 hypothetical protein GCM10010289_69120 [Streptomyces violascens]